MVNPLMSLAFSSSGWLPFESRASTSFATPAHQDAGLAVQGVCHGCLPAVHRVTAAGLLSYDRRHEAGYCDAGGLRRYGARRRHVQSRPVRVQEERDNFIWLIVNDEKEISAEGPGQIILVSPLEVR